MVYAISFFLFAAVLGYHSISHGGWWLVLLWPAIDFLIVAAGYACLGPRVMGKRSDGRYALWALLVLLPFRLYVYGCWWLGRMISRASTCTEVAPGVWIGRRARMKELPVPMKLVIDLTSEFAGTPGLPAEVRYTCVGALDRSVPDENECRAALAQIATAEGPVYIHCAQGHGRSGTLAAVLLIARGDACDVVDAERQLATKRPGVRLNSHQRLFVTRLTQRPPA